MKKPLHHLLIVGSLLLLFVGSASWQARDTAAGVAYAKRRHSPTPTATDTPAPTATPAPIDTPVPTAPPPSALSTAIDGYLGGLLYNRAFHGAVLVARDGQVILSKGYGMADAANGVPNTPQTRFRLASLSKQFTAMAIMQLVAQGKIHVQDSICAYLAPCPAAWRPVTVRHLLTHTSGIPDYTEFADYEKTEMLPTTPEQLVARFRNRPLQFAPGTAYRYDNSGYVLLGVIVERVSGRSFEDALTQGIFAPLGLQNTGVDHNIGQIVGQAIGYRSFAAPASFLDTSTLFACGDLYASVEDLYRWDQALYGEQLLPAALRDEMFTPGLRNYGYGWKIEHPAGRLRISHSGEITGFATFIARYPNEHVTVIVLSNMITADPTQISSDIAGLVFGS